ncbi:VOC family protein [Gilvimarinus agarilyticus]|uniref:VOC family protein n=1 Tax=unclassified Gilvimarinus TaxID=2642066 RepID=UPI001C0A6513|nr:MULTISPECIES: VOC family protein [unclassified Gilvimarinus]MBU2884238.1 VOC family protein [Gilvimarinus agarilyticus]MDO6569377.1 VOC family protein [Gilvimarinus sp. 2_MG-2023]MDO6747531.1 VOC family protein [Gilvimarinus sp. 1_MG-2023]
MDYHQNIQYLEIPSRNLSASKAFFQSVFNFRFTDYGPDYTAFVSDTIEGGFFTSDTVSLTENGAALIVFFSRDLSTTEAAVLNAGGTIIQPTFDFPGGRRFQFTEPGGSEFAVWSDQ